VSTIDDQWVQGPSLVDAVWRYRYRVLLAAVVCGVLGFLLSGLRAPQYTGVTTILFRDPSESQIFDTGAVEADPERLIPQQASRVLSRDVLQRAARNLNGEAVESLERKVGVEPDVQLNRMVITGTDAAPAAAAEIANTVAVAYERTIAEENTTQFEEAGRVLQQQMNGLNEQVAELDDRLRTNPDDPVAASRLRTYESSLLALETRASELAANAAARGSGVLFREEAIPPEEPSSPKPLRDGILVAALGFAVASSVAYARSTSRRRIDGRADPASVLDVPLLGEIPTFSELSAGAGSMLPGSEASEAYELVLASVDFSLTGDRPASILVTSAKPGDGKTSTALQLAVAAARQSRRVTLVDGDVRAHGLSTMLRADEHNGLMHLAHHAGLDECTRRYRLSETAQLAFVPTGAPGGAAVTGSPASLMRTPELKHAFDRIKGDADLVIVDSPPVLTVADTTMLASYVDAIVLVVDRNTELEELVKVQERLAFVPTRVLGYVYNRAVQGRDRYYPYPRRRSRWSRLVSPILPSGNGDDDAGASSMRSADVPSNGQHTT
jgi:capsular exopolysaccharide synthesis family protein